MKKLYIYKGLEHKDNEYKWLTKAVENLYDIEFKRYNLLRDSFEDLIKEDLEENSVVFGFSIGALIAYKLKTQISLGLYCSPTPILDGSNSQKKDIIEKSIGIENSNYIQSLKYSSPNAKKFYIFYGDQEQWHDIEKFHPQYIKDSGHELTENYKNKIVEILTL